MNDRKKLLFYVSLTSVGVALVAFALMLAASTSNSGANNVVRRFTGGFSVRPATPAPAKVTFGLSPNSQPMVVGTKTTTDVTFETPTQVNVIDLFIRYDTRAFASVDIVPGTFFTKAQVFEKKIDPATGTILFTIGSLVPAKGKSTLATISLTPKSGIAQGSVTIEGKTIVSAVGQVKVTTGLPMTTQYSIIRATP